MASANPADVYQIIVLMAVFLGYVQAANSIAGE